MDQITNLMKSNKMFKVRKSYLKDDNDSEYIDEKNISMKQEKRPVEETSKEDGKIER